MERKVIQLAGKTLVVSLPSKWAKRHGVRKGDSVFVDEHDGEIAIRTSKDAGVEKVSLELKEPYEFIKREIDVCYKKGADELSLSFENPSTIKAVEEILESTMGFEIISQGRNSCVVKSVATAVEGEFDNILRRIFLTLLSMADESYAAVSGSSMKKLNEIAAYDRTINKLTNFCKRVLSKRGYREKGMEIYMYCIVWELERIADEYRELCAALAGAKGRIGDDVGELYRETNAFVRDFYILFYKFSQERGVELTNRKKSLSKKCGSLMHKKKGAEAVVLHHLCNVISSVYDMAGPFYATIL